jgi:hypothetical protein
MDSMDCGSLLPLSEGQPAGRRTVCGVLSPRPFRVGASRKAFRWPGDFGGSRAAWEKRQQAAAVHVETHTVSMLSMKSVVDRSITAQPS